MTHAHSARQLAPLPTLLDPPSPDDIRLPHDKHASQSFCARAARPRSKAQGQTPLKLLVVIAHGRKRP